MTNWAQQERRALCDRFVEAGPDAPTLCGDWTTRDLAAHLVVRERRPDAAVGIVVALGPLRRHGERTRLAVAAKPWDVLISMVRSGPPVWSPTHFGPLDAAANTAEFFVHHEDVRRAGPHWEPRALDPAEDDALAAVVGRMGMLLRRSPVGLELRRPDGTVLSGRKGPRTVTVEGDPGELLLFAFGRQAHADVRYQGDEADIEAVRTARFGI